jgi:hypothetical protein
MRFARIASLNSDPGFVGALARIAAATTPMTAGAA